MPFLNPMFLLALAAATLPIALHLLNRRNPKPVPFSTLRFLDEAIARTRKSRHLTQVTLLLFRILILAALALAFARPQLRSADWLPEGPRTVVIVIDATASMQARQLDSTTFDLARQWAEALLRDLREQDKVALVLAGHPEGRVIFPAISNHSLVQKALSESTGGFGQADLVEELRRTVADLLAEDSAAALEVHLFTDAQRASWPIESTASLTELLQAHQVRLLINRLPMPSAGNAALTAIDVTPSALLGDGEIRIRAQVRADAVGGGANVVQLWLQGEERARLGVTVSPGGEAPIAMPVLVREEADFVTGRLELQEDAYSPDNSAWFALGKQPHVPVLLVAGSSSPVATQGDTFYLERALNPHRLPNPLIRAETIEWSVLQDRPLTPYQAVMICNPPAIQAGLALKLETYVRSGGLVVLYPGPQEGLSASWQNLAALQHLKLSVERFPTTRAFSFLSQPSPAVMERAMRRVLRTLPEVQGQARLRIEEPADSPPVPGSAWCFQYPTETPVALRLPLGGGAFWLSSLSANRAWSEWPLSPSFVVFQQLLVQQSFQQNRPTSQVQTGGLAEVQWAGDERQLRADITDPRGRRQTRLLERPKADQPFLLAGFPLPGIYRIDLQTTPPTRRIVAVNVPSAESSLTAITEEEVASSLAPAEVIQATDPAQQRQALAGLTSGHPLWPWLLLAAFLLALVEVIFANLRSWRQSSPNALDRVLRRRR